MEKAKIKRGRGHESGSQAALEKEKRKREEAMRVEEANEKREEAAKESARQDAWKCRRNLGGKPQKLTGEK